MKRWLIAVAVLALASGQRTDTLGEHRLTELSRKQARAVCKAADRLQDLCAAAGRWQNDVATCEQVVQSCREQRPGPHVDCELAQFDFGPSCTATVNDYLSCIEAWNTNLSCELIDTQFDQPKVLAGCVPLLEACPQLIPEYGDPRFFIPECDPATAPERMDVDDDVRGIDVCRPLPARMVVLGDSIASCFPDPASNGCAPDFIAEYLRAQYVPELQYEMHAFPGAITASGLTQAQGVAPGPGHVLVWVYLGGNDISQCDLPDIGETLACADLVIANLRTQWQPIFDYFSDPARFPDGATFMLNTQYGLRDECASPGGDEQGTTPERYGVLRNYNQQLFLDPASARADTVAIDQYPDWLGHARYANNGNCPHCYRDDNSPWLHDGVHPNPTGHQHIAAKWKVAIDHIYGACPPP